MERACSVYCAFGKNIHIGLSGACPPLRRAACPFRSVAFGPLQSQLRPLLQNAQSKNPPLYATKYTLIVYPIISLRFAKFHDIIKTCCIIISQLKRIRGNCVRLTRHWRDFVNRILGLGRRSRNNKSSQGSCFIAKQRSDIKENLSASQAC